MYKCGSRQRQGRYSTCTYMKNVWEYIFRQREIRHSASQYMLDMYKCGSRLICCSEVPREIQFVGLFDGSLFICIRLFWLICCTDMPREREYASLFLYVSFHIYTLLLTFLASLSAAWKRFVQGTSIRHTHLENMCVYIHICVYIFWNAQGFFAFIQGSCTYV